MNSKTGTFLSILFVVFWSVATLTFDGFTFVPALRQLIALKYVSTEGRMLGSAVTHSEDSEGGPSYGVSVRYAYVVGAKEYIGKRYRYGAGSSSDSGWAHTVVQTHPPGAKVEVFYDPKNPGDSVLAVGLMGSDLFLMAFMTPFNAVMLFFFWAIVAHLRKKWFKPLAGGVRIKTELKATRVRLMGWPPIGTAVAIGALVAFCSIFVVCFFWGGFHPRMKTMLISWSVILGGAVTAGGWHWFRSASGHYDLILDELSGTLELPATQGRKSRRRIALGEVESLRVEQIRHPSDKDEDSRPMYAPTIQLRNPPGSERLVQWSDRAKAEGFVEWLRTKLPKKSGLSRPLAGNF